MNDKGHYVLNQTSIIGLMETQWGEGISADTITENDKLRFFYLIFTADDSASKLQCLLIIRNELEDPMLTLRAIFQFLALDFNNAAIKVELPDAACDIEDLDANDGQRIRIKRDGMFP